MSNYFQYVQNISKIKLGKAPATFDLVSNKKYDKIKDAIKNAIQDFFLSVQHNFRSKKENLTITTSNNKYSHVYGMIQNITIDKVELEFEEENNDILLNTDVVGTPTKYTIFDENIILYPIPDKNYTAVIVTKTDKYIKQINVIDATSSSGQAKVYLASTTGLVAGDTITIDPVSTKEETAVILSVAEDNYVTLTTNLLYTHSDTTTIEKYKEDFEYETDTPRFPSRFHKIIEFHALRQLYFQNAPKLAKYNELYETFAMEISIADRGTTGRKPKFVFKNY